MNVASLAYSVKQAYIKHHDDFSRFFALELGDYMQGIPNALTGFDIIKFDQDIKTPEGMSCRDWIQQKYGDPRTFGKDEPVKLIEELLKYPEID